MRRSKALKILAAVAIGLAMACGTARLLAGCRLRQLEARWKEEVARERERLAATAGPPLRGEGRDVLSAEEREAVVARLDRAWNETRAGQEVQRAVEAGPGEPPPAAVTAFAEEHRAAVAAHREAVRANRSGWVTAGADLPFPRPDEAAARLLVLPRPDEAAACLLVLDGHERARAGDARGAAERYLDAARLATDAAVLSHDLGCGLAGMALGPLARLVGSGAMTPADLGAIERELELVASSMPPAADAVRRDRLVTQGVLLEWARAGAGNLVGPGSPLWERALGERALIAIWWDGLDRRLREIEDASRKPARVRAGELDVLREGSRGSWNGLVRMFVYPETLAPFFLEGDADHFQARLRLARATIALARRRAERGALPGTLEEAGVETEDPFAARAGVPLRYEARKDGGAAKLWSLGMDGADDGGRPYDAHGAGDIVVELAPRR